MLNQNFNKHAYLYIRSLFTLSFVKILLRVYSIVCLTGTELTDIKFLSSKLALLKLNYGYLLFSFITTKSHAKCLK